MRRLRMTTSLGILAGLLLVLGPFAALVEPNWVSSRVQAEITCDDFVRQEAAQALLDADASYAATLDADGDGVACNETEGEDEPDDSRQGDTTADDEATDAEPTVDASPEATPATNEADALSSSNPLRGRFGGNREDFERVYGEPVDDEERAYPVGLIYEVDGYRRVSVVFHRDYVVYVTALPERTEPWTQSQAEEVAFAFLPADWVQVGPPIQTDDGDLLIAGHSAYMETRFSADTYALYGAQGQQGDVYFLLRLDANAEVTGVEVGLGNNVQSEGDEAEEEGDAAEGETAVDPEAAEYLEDVRAQFDRLVDSVDEFGRLITDPNFTTDQALFDRLIEILILWSSASANASSLEPPTGYEDLHQTFAEYARLLAGAASDLRVGLSSGDQASIESGGAQLQEAIALQPGIEEQLAAAGV